MAVTITSDIQDAAANAVGDLFDDGFIVVYDGSVPADAKAGLGSSDVLATVELAANAFGAASTGVITLQGVPLSDNDIDKSSTATYFRMYASDADDAIDTDVILQGTVGTAAADMIVDSVNFVAGGVFTITSLTVTMPDGS